MISCGLCHQWGGTALHWAALKNNVDVARLLIETGGKQLLLERDSTVRTYSVSHEFRPSTCHLLAVLNTFSQNYVLT